MAKSNEIDLFDNTWNTWGRIEIKLAAQPVCLWKWKRKKNTAPPYPGCTEKNNFRLVTTKTENPLCDNPSRGQVVVLSLSYFPLASALKNSKKIGIDPSVARLLQKVFTTVSLSFVFISEREREGDMRGERERERKFSSSSSSETTHTHTFVLF